MASSSSIYWDELLHSGFLLAAITHLFPAHVSVIMRTSPRSTRDCLAPFALPAALSWMCMHAAGYLSMLISHSTLPTWLRDLLWSVSSQIRSEQHSQATRNLEHHISQTDQNVRWCTKDRTKYVCTPLRGSAVYRKVSLSQCFVKYLIVWKANMPHILA